MSVKTGDGALDIKQAFLVEAEQIFHGNLQEGYSKWRQMPYRYIAPATTEYTYQWQWDTAFHAIVLSHFDNSWAKAEIESYLAGQWDDGFLPHVIFWDEKHVLPHWAYIESYPWTKRIHSTAITQPAMTAIAVEQIYQKDHDQEFLKRTLPKLASYHRWLLVNRDPDYDQLLAIISPNESGMDELPVFQYALNYQGNNPARIHYIYRYADFLNQTLLFNNHKILQKDYFNVEEILFNCVFAEANRSLGRLFRILGKEAEAIEFLEQATATENAILEKCWDEDDGIFYSLYRNDERKARVKTAASLLPLFLDGLKGDRLTTLIEKHLLNPQEFWTNYPVPSVAINEPTYEPGDPSWSRGKLLFRGPTWINLNWFIVKGLRKHGYDDIAEQMVGKMVDMVSREGFREYYNPDTGQGYRRKSFGWSTLIADLL
jgi:glycogen debranching enzyme